MSQPAYRTSTRTGPRRCSPWARRRPATRPPVRVRRPRPGSSTPSRSARSVASPACRTYGSGCRTPARSSPCPSSCACAPPPRPRPRTCAVPSSSRSWADLMPSIAPLVAGVWRRLSNLPGPLAGTGEASNGEPVQIEIWINGQWVDITDYVMVRDDQGRIAITSGIRDEGSQTEQSRSTLPLKNQDGRFTRRNPTGPYYGYIGRNTPCRISVPDGMGGKSYRQWSEISKWPKQWDPSGTDVWVDVNADGLLQRLSQAPPPERSLLYNAITTMLTSSLVAYWPGEDTTGTRLASALPTGSPMTRSGTLTP